MSVFLCESCMRHVRRDGRRTCHFCGAPVVPTPRVRGPRCSRAAMFVATAAITVACGGTAEPDDSGTTNDGATKTHATGVDGATTDSSVTDGGTSDDAPQDALDDEYHMPPPP